MNELSEFWYTPRTMCLKYGYDVVGFEYYGAVHIFWLALCVISCAVMAVLYRRSGEKARRAVLWSITGIIIVLEVIQDIVLPLTGQWEWQFLPLDLCSVNLFVCMWYAAKPSKLVGELLYSTCLPGAAAALLSPSWVQLPINNFCHIHSSVHHIVLIMFPVLLIAGGFKPNIKRLWKVAVIMVCTCAVIFIVNSLMGQNFFFLSSDNSNPVLVFCGKIFPDYRIGMVLIAAAVWLVMYLPWIFTGNKNTNGNIKHV